MIVFLYQKIITVYAMMLIRLLKAGTCDKGSVLKGLLSGYYLTTRLNRKEVLRRRSNSGYRYWKMPVLERVLILFVKSLTDK